MSRDLIIIRVIFVLITFPYLLFSLRSFVTIKCHLVLVVVLFNLSSCLIYRSYLICVPYLYFTHFNFVHVERHVFKHHVICLPRTHHVVYVYLSLFFSFLLYYFILVYCFYLCLFRVRVQAQSGGPIRVHFLGFWPITTA